MSVHSHPHRIPRARVQPLRRDGAIALLNASIDRPPRPETILLLLDDDRRGVSIVTVTGTDEPDQVVGVIEHVLEAVAATDSVAVEIGSMVVATVRPGGGLEPGDGDRWFEMCDLSDDHGIELVEWFVFGRSLSCPRDQVGAPPRW